MAHYLQHMRKRSHVRGVTIAAASKFIAVLIFAFVLSMVVRYMYVAQGLESPLVAGPFDLLSTGWYIAQAGGFLIGMFAGAVCAHFSPSGSWLAAVVLCAVYAAINATGIPSAAGWGLSVYWVLVSPAAVLLGTWCYRRREAANAI